MTTGAVVVLASTTAAKAAAATTKQLRMRLTFRVVVCFRSTFLMVTTFFLGTFVLCTCGCVVECSSVIVKAAPFVDSLLNTVGKHVVTSTPWRRKVGVR